MPVKQRVLAIAVAIAALGSIGSVRANASEAGVDQAHVPPGATFLSSTTGFMGFPALHNSSYTDGEGVRHPRYTLGYTTERDAVNAGGVVLRQSIDGGANWPDFASADGRLQPMNFIRLAVASGAVYAIDFEDLSLTEGCTTTLCRGQFDRRMMAGTGWVDAGTATVTFSQTIAWSRFHQGPILMSDGKTLLATMYGRYANLTWFTIVVRSADGGVTWNEVSQLATGAAQSWAEAGIAPTSDGGLIAVIRKDENFRGCVPANVALYTRKSTSQTGAGPWSGAVRLSENGGNSPSVELMANGTLVLASGRNDNQLRFSYDGRGTTWTTPFVPYANYPTTGGGSDGWYSFDPNGGTCDPLQRPLRHLGSSGTMGVEAISGNQLLVVGDRCASGWGCPCPWEAGGAGWMCPKNAGGYGAGAQHGIWKSIVTVDNERLKLDLQGMFERDELTVLDPAFARYGYCPGGISGCRQSYAAFAFDGDIRSDASTVTANRSVTLRLPQPYSIAALGLHVHLQGAADVRLEVSSNGTSWSTPARAARDGIMRQFTAPVTAQYVRISDPNAITDTTAAFLNELEIYTG